MDIYASSDHDAEVSESSVLAPIILSLSGCLSDDNICSLYIISLAVDLFSLPSEKAPITALTGETKVSYGFENEKL